MNTEILKIDDTCSVEEIVKKDTQTLEKGGLVAIPTETVYGLACRAEPGAIAKLDAVKGRNPDKRYTLHIGSPETIFDFVPTITMRAQKLIQATWPGPLTIVFELTEADLEDRKAFYGNDISEILYRSGTLGVRCPDDELTTQILDTAVVPIVAPSANPSDQKPAINAQEVANYFDGQIEMIVDNGITACQYSQSSTVVKVTEKDITVLREGVYSKDEVLARSVVQLTFVCTGNTCRSPMAEGLCRKHFANILNCNLDEVDSFGYKVRSAGVAAFDGSPVSSNAVNACRQRGIDISSYRSSLLTEEMVEQSDLLFVMSSAHLEHVLAYFPEAEFKTFLLDENGNISDPVGQSEAVYLRCADQIEKAIERRMRDIL